ncbi:MAG TPA: hypothetical protein VLU96_07195 [Gaiellaceae bacterium]|nr:hypothetical protein [Gaiellaceae bacterium]
MRSSTALVALAVGLLATGCSGGRSHSESVAPRAVVTIQTVRVGRPGNPSAAIVPFHPGVYGSCSQAPSRHSGCRLVGGVGYEYGIGELEVTVRLYVAFLNTVDPSGENRHDLYIRSMSPSSWPKYGPIRRQQGSSVPAGRHYSVAYPQWADKPIGFANFLRAASFANALTNGDILSRTTSSADGFGVTTYRVRLSRDSEQGMYDLRGKQSSGATRTRSTGFVVPSQNEWIKAAYYDPKGVTFSYWIYPTGPFDAPHPSQLDSDGNVVNAATQPLSTFSPRGSQSSQVPSWCPTQAGGSCGSVNPFGLSTSDYQSRYQASLSTVGQTRTRSPWGTLDQGGNVVEWTDTVAPSPLGSRDPRVWRWAHGGVANAPVYQLWISAVGRFPQADAVTERINPWEGFRVGVIGDLAPKG